jgi:hypothetical protein
MVKKSTMLLNTRNTHSYTCCHGPRHCHSRPPIYTCIAITTMERTQNLRPNPTHLPQCRIGSHSYQLQSPKPTKTQQSKVGSTTITHSSSNMRRFCTGSMVSTSTTLAWRPIFTDTLRRRLAQELAPDRRRGRCDESQRGRAQRGRAREEEDDDGSDGRASSLETLSEAMPGKNSGAISDGCARPLP